MARREKIDLASDPMIVATFVGTTDGTTNAQVVGGATVAAVNRNPDVVSYLVEPVNQRAFGLQPLNHHQRAMVVAGRGTGTGTWTYTIDARRGTAGTFNEIAASATLLTNTAPRIIEPFFTDGIFDGGTHASLDALVFRLNVTPGQAVAAEVFVQLFCFEGHLAVGNPGHELSPVAYGEF